MTDVRMRLGGIEIHAIPGGEGVLFRLIVYRQDALQYVNELSSVMLVGARNLRFAQGELRKVSSDTLIRRSEGQNLEKEAWDGTIRQVRETVAVQRRARSRRSCGLADQRRSVRVRRRKQWRFAPAWAGSE